MGDRTDASAHRPAGRSWVRHGVAAGLAAALDERAASHTRDLAQSDHAASPALDLGPTHDLVESPVSALGQHVGPQGQNRRQGRRLAKLNHPVDALEGGQQLHALAGWNQGAIRSLEPPDAGVAVDGHDESVAQSSGLLEAADVSHVQQIEAAVGENHGLATPLRRANDACGGVTGQELAAGSAGAHAGAHGVSDSSGGRGSSPGSVLRLPGVRMDWIILSGVFSRSGSPSASDFMGRLVTCGSFHCPLSSK